MVFSHTTPDKFENAAVMGHFGLCLRRTRARKSLSMVIHNAIVFEKLCFRNVLCPHLSVKPAFSNSSSLKSVFEKLCFRDGLMWTLGLNVKEKLRRLRVNSLLSIF